MFINGIRSGWILRICVLLFTGRVTDHDVNRVLDDGILRADWFSLDEIRQNIQRHRSPLVMQCIQDHIAGKRWPTGITESL